MLQSYRSKWKEIPFILPGKLHSLNKQKGLFSNSSSGMIRESLGALQVFDLFSKGWKWWLYWYACKDLWHVCLWIPPPRSMRSSPCKIVLGISLNFETQRPSKFVFPNPHILVSPPLKNHACTFRLFLVHSSSPTSVISVSLEESIYIIHDIRLKCIYLYLSASS